MVPISVYLIANQAYDSNGLREHHKETDAFSAIFRKLDSNKVRNDDMA